MQTTSRSAPNPARRRFLRQAALAGAWCAAGWPVRAAAPVPATLRAAVIGHTGRGDYGHGLEAIFQHRPGIELVGLADPVPAGRARTAARIEAPRQYADYREMLERERPHLVSLGMRHADQHFTIARAVLEAGAHLYCEKPFTTTPAEADTLLALAQERGLRIAVAHTMRLAPIVRRLHTALREGLVGDIVELRAYGKQDARAGGEDMMVLGTHLFDLLRLVAGDPLWCSARVLWQGRDITPRDARLVRDQVGPVAGDQVFAQFAFGRGIHATFTSAAALRDTTGHWGIEIHGSRAVARLNGDLTPNVFVRRAAAWQAEGRTDQWQPLDARLAQHPPPPHDPLVQDWLAAIRERREPECGGRNGAWAVEMVMAVYWSALEGRRAAFPLRQRGHPLPLPG